MSCPEREALAAFVTEPDGPLAAEIVAHLESCPRCVAALSTIEPEPFHLSVPVLDEAELDSIDKLTSRLTERATSRYRGSASRFASDNFSRRYLLESELDRGGMGRIMAAQDLELRRQVVIKLMLPKQGYRARQRFIEEAQVTGQLDHPNIVPVHEVGLTDDGEPYFAMKRVDGVSLKQRIAAEREGIASATSLSERLALFCKLCDAVAFAHSRGVLHRDLKPSNVMLGEYGEVYVMDWGLARLGSDSTPAGFEISSDRREEPASATRHGTIIGTLTYMPPEQARGDVEAISERSDVYSLGAILYELLTRRAPYAGSAAQVHAQVVTGQLIPPRQRASAVPWELESVVLKAMAHDPEARYASVVELQRDVQAFSEGQLLAAADYSPLGRLLKWLARYRLRVAAAALLLAGVLVASLIGAWQQARALDVRCQGVAERLAQLEPERDRLVAGWRQRMAYLEAAGSEPSESLRERSALAAQLEQHLALVRQLEGVLERRPGHPRALALRRQAGAALGWVALCARDRAMALHAFRALERHGAPAEMTAPLLQAVADADRRLARYRARRLSAALDDARRGLQRPGRDPAAPTLAELVDELAGFRDATTLQRLADELAAQSPTSERDLISLLGQSLGRLQLAEAVPALAGWLHRVLDDEPLAIEAGLALCETRSASAYEPLARARRRLGLSSPAWRAIRRKLALVPLPPTATETVDDRFDRALALEERGDSAGAIVAYGALLAAHPDHHDARLNLASALARVGKREQAGAEFGRLIERFPERADGYIGRGALRFEQARPAEALADFELAAQRDAERADVFRWRGLARLQLGDDDKAGRDANRAVTLDPADARNHLLRGEVWLLQCRPRDAIFDFTQALALDGSEGRALLGRASAHRFLRQFDAALLDLDRYLERNPREAAGLVARAELRILTGRSRLALRDLRLAAKRREMPDEVRLALVRGLIALEAWEDARAQVDIGLERAPKHRMMRLHRVQVCLATESLEQAIADLEALLAQPFEDGRMRSALMAIMAKGGGARAELRELISGGDPRRAILEARRLRGRGDHRRALALLDDVIEADPKNASARLERGRILAGAPATRARARADYDAAVALAPLRSDVRLARARLQMSLRAHKPALEDLNVALQTQPDAPELLACRGQLLLAMGAPRRAVADLRRAVAQDPTLAHAGLLLARQLLADGERDEATSVVLGVMAHADDQTQEALAALLDELAKD